MLFKGHAPSSGIPVLAVALFAILAGTPALEAWAAGGAPLGGAATVRYGPFGDVSSRQFIGRELPPLPSWVRTQQGPGPDPDSNLTLGAPLADHRQPNAAPTATMNRVAFSSNGEPMNDDGAGPVGPPDPDEPNYDLWIMRPDGSEQVRILNLPGDQIEPAYDPGGRLIAFAGNQTGRWEIYTVEVSSGAVRCLTDRHPGDKRHPTWNPDGNWFAFAGNADGNWSIYKMRAAADQPPVRLTTSPANDTSPAWGPLGNPLSPSGNAIAYTATVGATTRIYWVDAETMEVDALTDAGGDGLASDRDPAWSKFGAELAFASNRLREGEMPANRNYNIWRMSAVGEIVGPPVTDDQLVSNRTLTDTRDDLNPAWSPESARQPRRVYYESYRASAPGEDRTDIWATFYEDTTPPLLVDLPHTTVAGEGTSGKRQFLPGDTVYIHAPVYDADSGVARVFARIKDADRKVWDIRFWGGTASWDSNFDGVQYLEADYQTVATIELFDDGDAENGDAAAGDGMFSGMWEIPLALARDFVIDIFPIDEAGNSLNFDSVYGFTSRVFSPRGNVLFVNDYCEGQQFLYRLGYNNDWGSSWYTESFYTFNPGYSPNASNQTPGEAYHVSKDTIKTYAAAWGVDEEYEIWRVISRGPVPESVYQYYLPILEYQLDPVEAADPERGHLAQPTRELRVAERAVIWASPHPGNRWVADGSIIDAGTQADLSFFLQRGGRLFLSSPSLAWALTLNGTVQNEFLTNALRARFVRNPYAMNIDGSGPDVDRPIPVSWDFQLVGSSGDPVAGDPWVGTGSPISHWGGRAAPSAYDGDDAPTSLETPASRANNTKRDAHDYSWRPDVIEAVGGAQVLYSYGSATGPTAGVRYVDEATSARVVYLSFGFESIHRGYHAPSNLPPHCRNHRAHLTHNVLCWMRTGAMQGKVLSIEGGKPITGPNPIVLLWRGSHTMGDRSTPPDFAVRCQDDGSYMISGLPPAFYSMEAIRPGYEIDHYDGWVVHGGWEPFTVDFTIVKARPGVISGTVTSEATGELLPLVVVDVFRAPLPEEDEEENGDVNGLGAVATAQFEFNDEPAWDELEHAGTITTGVQGTYKVENLPPGDYYVRADGAAIDYGSQWFLVTVVTGSTTVQDFQLPAADGVLVATVIDGDSDEGVENALVRATAQEGVAGSQERTDATGVARIDLPAGTYTVTVNAPGYRDPSDQVVTLASGETRNITVRVFRQPPGRITGTLVAATSGQPVGGIRVHLLSNDVPIMSTTTLGEFVEPADGSPRWNYEFREVPTGTLAVRPEPVGFTASPAQREALVESGLTTANVNFTLTSLWTFPANLQLVSVPYDYSRADLDPDTGEDLNEPASLLSLRRADLKMATWETWRETPGEEARQRYRIYPQAPADRFRVGRGYWLRLPGATDVTRQGDPAPDPASISLDRGWNLIGAPFPALVDFYSSQVVDATGISRSVHEALADGLVEGGMFAYVMGGYQITSVFNPWVGTWLKAGAPVTLRVGRSGALASAAAARPAVQTPQDGWLAQIETSVDGLMDSATYFGAAPAASAGYNRGLDVAKPPAPDMAPYVYTAFVNDDWGDRSGNYSVDVRPAAAAAERWTLKVWTNAVGSDVTMRWPDLSGVPSSVRPVIRDIVTGRSVYMRTSAGHTFRATDQPREFEIVLENADAALTVTALSAQGGAGSNAQIVYTLSASAEVSIEVLNMAGRAVRRLAAAGVQPAGTHTMTWDGRSSAGTQVPRGRYLVRLTARNAGGAQVQQVAPLDLAAR